MGIRELRRRYHGRDVAAAEFADAGEHVSVQKKFTILCYSFSLRTQHENLINKHLVTTFAYLKSEVLR